MISELRLHNFKCFADQTVRLGPLTLLVGANASGKSSVVQALLLLRQSHLRRALGEGTLLLNGKLASVGTVLDAYYQQAEDLDIRIEFDVADTTARFAFARTLGDAAQRTLRGTTDYEPSVALFANHFNYLNAERLGPKLLFPMQEDDRAPYDVGIHGEYAVHIVGRDRQEMLANPQLAYRDEATGEVAIELYEQTRYWMRQIIPNFEMAVTPIDAGDQVQALFGNLPGQQLVRPSNIGFGLIYTLPIVVAALVAPAGSLLIVENPEAHLHPASQSIIGRFLARVAGAGVQVIIETHSDHVLNGIRRAVRETLLPPSSVVINYFAAAGEGGPQRVIQPKMYSNGGIRPWPKGFFDQYEHDLRKLL